jgi:hypothetical protein
MGAGAVAGAVSALVLVATGAFVGSLLGGVPATIIGGAVGLIVGLGYGITLARVGSYDATPRNIARFVVDHSWSLLNTAVASLFLLVNLLIGNELNVEDSRRSATVVFVRGLIPNRKKIVQVLTKAGPQQKVVRTHFATTVGNVKVGVRPDSGVGLKEHEDVHVFQARLFGPFYLPLVGLGYLVAMVLPYWLLYHDRVGRPIRSVRDYFMRGVYPHVWHEEWAYKIGGTPP